MDEKIVVKASSKTVAVYANRGERGLTGATGPQGATGLTGLSGAVGAQGPEGPRGFTGERGPAGAKGDKGDTGAQGVQGVQGDAGPRGLKGDTGLQGIQGATGSAGADATLTQPIVDKSANYTIVAGDKFKLIRSTGSAITITIANVLAVGEGIDFIQDGAGQITFAASGVSLSSADSLLKTAKQYAGATVHCVASGQYRLIGNLG